MIEGVYVARIRFLGFTFTLFAFLLRKKKYVKE
jgi:hypothetical protein